MTMILDAARCTGCSYCVVGCPSGAIRLNIEAAPAPVIDAAACTLCGECVFLCPNNVFSTSAGAPPPPELDSQYNALVIGGGIGGLMTAAGLCRAGWKTLVLEQMSFPGGKYTHLDYHGYAISTAAWTCPGPNSRIGKLCTRLGARVDWVTIHDSKARGDHWVVLKDGTRFRSTDEAQENLVGGKKGLKRVYRWIADMYDPLCSLPQDLTARQYIQRYFPGNPAYENYVETIITYCFASQTLDTFSALETRRAILDALEQMKDWGTARGGTAAIIAALCAVIRENGGSIQTRTRVDSILVEDGKACGVRLQDGRELRARVVVHNAGLNRLVSLAGEKNLPADYVRRLRGAVPARVAALILGLNRDLLGREHSLLHTMGWERTLNCYAPTFFDPGLAPSGKHALDVFWVMQPPYDHRRELELVHTQLRQVFPDFEAAVEMEVPMFFSGAWTAEMAHRIGQSGAQRLDPLSPIPNLYLVGYDCIGYGMAGDIIPHGVERALQLILKDDRYAPQDEKAASKASRWAKSLLFRLMSLG